MPSQNENPTENEKTEREKESERIRQEKRNELNDRRRKLRFILEEESEKTDMDIDGLVRQYRYWLPNEPIYVLIEDIHRMAAVYKNILEEVKSLTPAEILSPNVDSPSATMIREKYENLELVSKGFLPNPSAASLASYALEKINKFAKVLLELMYKYGSELLQELRFANGTTVVLQVQVGWSPTLTVGVERTA